MILFRVANPRFKEFTLSGIGAEKVGGRWNEVGVRAVYCSENASLALLEYYVHSDNKSALPRELLVAKIHVPDEFELEELTPLPNGWDSYPYGAATTQPFSRRAESRDFAGLKVPSAVLPLECNVVLNPLYKDFGKVEILEFLALPLDPRLKDALL